MVQHLCSRDTILLVQANFLWYSCIARCGPDRRRLLLIVDSSEVAERLVFLELQFEVIFIVVFVDEVDYFFYVSIIPTPIRSQQIRRKVPIGPARTAILLVIQCPYDGQPFCW